MVIEMVIIGGGIIGRTAHKYFSSKGLECILLDNEEPFRGTGPSGGHLKPSWFGGLSKQEYNPALDLLDSCWELHSELFKVKVGSLSKDVLIYRIDTDVVLSSETTYGKVTEINPRGNAVKINYKDKEGVDHSLFSRFVIVAAGFWTQFLLPELFPNKIQAKKGISFRATGSTEAFVAPWAPYKQVVAHQQSDNRIWIGDGSAILDKNWDKIREQTCETRCLSYLPGSKIVDRLIGIRPYCKDKFTGPVFIKKYTDRVWAITGAGKSGTIGAGWSVLKVSNEILR